MVEDGLTDKEAEDLLRQFSEGKSNLHSFFTNVVKSPDTIKTGNLNSDELGMTVLPVRTYKELEMFCEDIANLSEFSTYFKKMSEIVTSSSLSKEAILLKLAVTIKKELADITPEKKQNSGWFKRKEPTPTP